MLEIHFEPIRSPLSEDSDKFLQHSIISNAQSM
jgi:hypothetical protein